MPISGLRSLSSLSGDFRLGPSPTWCDVRGVPPHHEVDQQWNNLVLVEAHLVARSCYLRIARRSSSLSKRCQI
jgi:hypothetical protein